jgi:hypothetical protein
MKTSRLIGAVSAIDFAAIPMTTIRRCGFVLTSLLLAMTSAVPAMAVVTVPPDLNPGDQYRLAFVTSGLSPATSSNIDDYNTFVTNAANSVTDLSDLGTEWKAIGSTASVAARSNTNTIPGTAPDVPVYRLDGVKIANNNADLWDATIAAPLTTTELLTTFAGEVWTGTLFNGTIASNFPLGGDPAAYACTNLYNGNWIICGWNPPPSTPRPLFAISGVLVVPPALSCVGFDAPLDGGAVTVKKNRVLPLKGRLVDGAGQLVDDLGITTRPVLTVTFDDGVNPAEDVTDDALPAGAGSDGNQFEFLDTHWQYNLKTKNYSASGTYTVTMVSGDSSEYTLEPECSAEFVIN